MATQLTEKYPYRGMTVSVDIAYDLIKEIFRKDVPLARSKIIAEVKEMHAIRGGVEKENIIKSVKNALEKLESDKIIFKPSRGHFRFTSEYLQSLEVSEALSSKASPSKASPSEVMDKTPKVSGIKIPAGLKPHGSGKESVYIYFLPKEKEQYILNGKTYWPCKVGKASASVEHRVNEQEKDKSAYIDAIFKTEDCAELESFLLSALRLSGRNLKTDKGREWFITTTEIVVQWWKLWLKAVKAGE